MGRFRGATARLGTAQRAALATVHSNLAGNKARHVAADPLPLG